MHISLQNKKGIKKIIKEIKKLDSNIKITEYKTITYFDSNKLKQLVRYDYVIEKVVLWIYDNEFSKTTNVGHELTIPIRYIDCVYC